MCFLKFLIDNIPKKQSFYSADFSHDIKIEFACTILAIYSFKSVEEDNYEVHANSSYISRTNLYKFSQ